MAAAPPVNLYTRVTASAEGIGKQFMGREIAAVMGWQGSAWLERSNRAREESTARVLRGLELKPGMVVADIGAGTGFYTRLMAPEVMPGGIVYAVEIQAPLLQQLRALAASPEFSVVRVVKGAEALLPLPANSLDMALMVDVYHELEYPFEMVASIVNALKPGGQLVLVEFKAEDDQVPIKALHKMSVRQIRREMALHPLQLERSVRGLPWQHQLVFRKTQ
ncbi:MAG: methyltransferase domain-containing protein [Pseudomonadota bacterium]